MGKNDGNYQRKFRNFLLNPTLQLRLGVLSISVAVFFCTLVIWTVYLHLFDFYNLVIELTDLEGEVREILSVYYSSLLYWITGVVLLYLGVTVGLSIYYTHRLVGPTIAFRRHIRSLIDGNFESRVTLRKKDAFMEVADDLNELAAQLYRNKNAS